MDEARRKFRWKKWMTVLLGIAAAIFLYARFLSGTLSVDAAIMNEENLENEVQEAVAGTKNLMIH